MPHLSPMKWFNIYIFMMFWLLMFMIKMNFMYLIYPNNKNYQFNLFTFKWKF